MSEINMEETSLESYTKELSDYDMIGLSEQLVSLDNEEKQQSQEKSTVVSKYTAELKRIAAEKQRIIHMMGSREEYVEEECYFEYDYNEGVIRYFSASSGLEVKNRPITNEERQLKMFSDKQKADKSNDDAVEEEEEEEQR